MTIYQASRVSHNHPTSFFRREVKTKRISQEDLVKDSASSLFANAGRNPDPHLRHNIRFLFPFRRNLSSDLLWFRFFTGSGEVDQIPVEVKPALSQTGCRDPSERQEGFCVESSAPPQSGKRKGCRDRKLRQNVGQNPDPPKRKPEERRVAKTKTESD